MIQILDYNLPDIALVDSIETKFLLWIPDKMYIVLGASNYIEDAVFKDVVEKDNIPIIKRKTGGQTVILTPNTLVISAIITDETILKPKDVFNRFNDLIIGIIEKDHTIKFQTKGISDIATGGKKILGSSMYRGKGNLFYHAVLNYNEPSSTFQKYLKFPKRVPDYRLNRSHSEFVTSLRETGYTKSLQYLKKEISFSLNTILTQYSTEDKVLEGIS